MSSKNTGSVHFPTVSSRIRHIMSETGLQSVLGAAKTWDLAQSTLHGAMKRNAISRSIAKQIGRSSGFLPHWIQTGTGPMRPGDTTDTRAAWGDASPIIQPDPYREAQTEGKEASKSAAYRVRELWGHSKLDSLSAFSETCGLCTETIQDILETDEVDDEAAGAIARSLNVEYEWVRHGKGPIQKQGAETEGPVGLAAPHILKYLRDVARSPAYTTGQNFVTVPKVSSRISVGACDFPEEARAQERYAFHADWLRSIGARPGRIVLLEVEGDSMSPVLEEGDVVLIDLDRTRFREGRLFAVGIGDTLFIKRLQLNTGFRGPRMAVISVNSQYRSFECRPDDIWIAGEVLWFGRTLV